MLITQNSEKTTGIEAYITQFREKVQEIYQGTQMSEEDKARQLQKILQKLKNGSKLTGEELSFVSRYYPEMYIHVARVQNQRQQLESQFQSAKSKEEVSQIYSRAMTAIGEGDPDKEMLQAAYSKVYSEFQKTPEYNRLPQTNEEADKKKKSGNLKNISPKDQVTEEQEKFIYPEFDVNG